MSQILSLILIGNKICQRIFRNHTLMRLIKKSLNFLQINMLIKNGLIMMSGVMILHGYLKISKINSKNIYNIMKIIFAKENL